jgi:alpha-glucosidase
VGEVFGEHPTISKFLGENQDGLNLIFLFDMLFYKYDAAFFRERLVEYNQYYASPRVPTFVVGNHDNKRSIGRVKGDLEKAKLLAVLQLTTRGVPVVYYGEEIGMLDAEIDKKDALDPISHMYASVPTWLRKRMPVPLNRDVCRTPIGIVAFAGNFGSSPFFYQADPHFHLDDHRGNPDLLGFAVCLESDEYQMAGSHHPIGRT